jgi:hypothetical protein
MDRHELVNQIVVHDFTQIKLWQACGVFLKDCAAVSDLVDDVWQGADLILLERFTKGNLAYHDEGIGHFGGWLYTVCHDAFADALTVSAPPWWNSVAVVETERLAGIVAIAQWSQEWDRVIQDIEDDRYRITGRDARMVRSSGDHPRRGGSSGDLDRRHVQFAPAWRPGA